MRKTKVWVNTWEPLTHNVDQSSNDPQLTTKCIIPFPLMFPILRKHWQNIAYYKTTEQLQVAIPVLAGNHIQSQDCIPGKCKDIVGWAWFVVLICGTLSRPRTFYTGILYLAMMLDFDLYSPGLHCLCSAYLALTHSSFIKRKMRGRARRADETAREKEIRLSKRGGRDRARCAQLSSQQNVNGL